MNLKSLRIFAAIMEDGSLKHAAERFALSESAASRQLKALERHLQITLFERQVRQLIPTAAAFALNDELSRALTTLDGLPQLAQSLKQQKTTIKLVSVARIVRTLVAPVVAQLTQQSPHLQLQLDVQTMRHARRWIARREYDLAIGRSSVEHPELLRVPFCACRPVVVLAKTHPLANVSELTLAQLQTQPYIAPSLNETQLGRDIEQLCQQQQINLIPTIETVSTHAACAIVEHGLGFTITDQLGALNEAKPQLVAVPLRSDFRFEFAFYLHKSDKHNPNVQQLIAMIREQAQRLLD
ncbi:LysR family transcriptional regulator [Ferrimonas senticii]|uniref:LysR family transcriptional regulator n=1 Tax=Ferrimonas senticii TaxID=394566 RepID=UPI000402B358|nr:LysR family transcriptional regulator [Ferrimonas senticii]